MTDETNTNPPEDNEEINPNSLKAFETLRNYLEEDGWHPDQLEGKYVLKSSFWGKNGQMTCYSQIRMDLEQFLFYAVLPFRIPEEKRDEISEFITRANYGMRIGNLEMDFSDGEVRYKSALDFESTELTPELIKHAIYPAVQTLDLYLPGILGIVYGDKSALGAIEEIES